MLLKELRDRGYTMNSKDEKLDLIEMISDNPFYNTTRAYANWEPTLTKSTVLSLRRAIKETNKNVNPIKSVNTIQSAPKTINKVNKQCQHYNNSTCKYGVKGIGCRFKHDFSIKQAFLKKQKMRHPGANNNNNYGNNYTKLPTNNNKDNSNKRK